MILRAQSRAAEECEYPKGITTFEDISLGIPEVDSGIFDLFRHRKDAKISIFGG